MHPRKLSNASVHCWSPSKLRSAMIDWHWPAPRKSYSSAHTRSRARRRNVGPFHRPTKSPRPLAWHSTSAAACRATASLDFDRTLAAPTKSLGALNTMCVDNSHCTATLTSRNLTARRLLFNTASGKPRESIFSMSS